MSMWLATNEHIHFALLWTLQIKRFETNLFLGEKCPKQKLDVITRMYLSKKRLPRLEACESYVRESLPCKPFAKKEWHIL